MNLRVSHLIVITPNFPTNRRPHQYQFVNNFVKALTSCNINCDVISPFNLFKYLSDKVTYKEEKIYNEAKYTVYRPKYLSLSNKDLIILNTQSIGNIGFEWAIKRTLPKLLYRNTQLSVLYGHFLYPAGYLAIKYGRTFNLSSFVSMGEGSLWSIQNININKLVKMYKNVTGVIAVSRVNKERLLNILQIPEEKIGLFPNGVDLTMFYPRDRIWSRKILNINNEDFIISFIGKFSKEKGIDILLRAANNLEKVKVILIGAGKIDYDNQNIIFKGTLPHDMIPIYLSASDIFVFPTLCEGSSNSLLEALACGLPVISSKGDFNDDILNDDVSIRIDPTNVNEIQEAILYLKNNPQVRRTMSENALRWIKSFDVKKRAYNILNWMNDLISIQQQNKIINSGS